MNQLDQLKRLSVIVADTGDFLQLARYSPRDATTNPSLILKAVRQTDYAPLVAETVAAHPRLAVNEIADRVLVRFGAEILRLVPGRVSTEVDARLSLDTAATLARARRIVGLYEAQGISRERVLIKLASTWEGICAAEVGRRQLQHDADLLAGPGSSLCRRRGSVDLALRRPHLRLAQEGGGMRLG